MGPSIDQPDLILGHEAEDAIEPRWGVHEGAPRLDRTAPLGKRACSLRDDLASGERHVAPQGER